MSIVYASLALAEILVLFASVITLLALAAREVVRTLFSGWNKRERRAKLRADLGQLCELRPARRIG